MVNVGFEEKRRGIVPNRRWIVTVKNRAVAVRKTRGAAMAGRRGDERSTRGCYVGTAGEELTIRRRRNRVNDTRSLGPAMASRAHKSLVVRDFAPRQRHGS